MRLSSVREFRDNATGLLRSKAPILVTRRGRLAGIFFPRPEVTLPLELKRELYDVLPMTLAALPVVVAERAEYASRIPWLTTAALLKRLGVTS